MYLYFNNFKVHSSVRVHIIMILFDCRKLLLEFYPFIFNNYYYVATTKKRILINVIIFEIIHNINLYVLNYYEGVNKYLHFIYYKTIFITITNKYNLRRLDFIRMMGIP